MHNERTWDIFCKVVDNFGDIGVCWRLSCDLAARGQRVRLWVDDAQALEWMAPVGDGQRPAAVELHDWTATSPAAGEVLPGDVVIEAFGCEVAPDFIASGAYSTALSGQFLSEKSQKTAIPPVWINLEYLSAEPYALRCHGLPSPVQHGPARGMHKWFFYPGFTAGTGGLIREPNWESRYTAWQATQHIHAIKKPAPRRISLFCYEPTALDGLLTQLDNATAPTELLVTFGRAAHAVKAVFESKNKPKPIQDMRGQLSISYLPLLTQDVYDSLLWGCDLNFVRGEDSLVRALWAGQALVWHIYPQTDGAHAAKLDAFLDWLQAPPSLRQFHQVWNGLSTQVLPELTDALLRDWCACVQAARTRLETQNDLTTQLLDFVEEKARSPR